MDGVRNGREEGKVKWKMSNGRLFNVGNFRRRAGIHNEDKFNFFLGIDCFH